MVTIFGVGRRRLSPFFKVRQLDSALDLRADSQVLEADDEA